jgi:hypothetical protein
VVKAGGVTKDAAWITQLHEEIAEATVQQLGGDASRFTGFIMDNTAANRAAMRELKTSHPTWLLLGCSAHAMSLLIKDFSDPPRKDRKPSAPAKAGSNKICIDWSARTAKALLKISNAVSDSERVRSLFAVVAKRLNIA